MTARGRVREVHFGRVLANDDPEGRGGLKVRVDTLVDGSALSDEYVPPSFPLAGKGEGFFFVPAVGALVEVEVVTDPETATEDLDARWRAVLYTDADAVPSEFADDPVNRGGIKFGDGKVLLFEKAKDVLALIGANVRLGEEDATHPVMRGDTYNDALSTYLNAFTTNLTTPVSGVIAALTALETAATGPLAPLKPGFTALKATWTTFATAVTTFEGLKDSWLSTKVKTE